jgi:maltose alpha-D-glucosyltransferase/alpha-amylase
LTPSIGKAEQTNTSILFGNQMILKIYRRVEEGTNPDLEVGNYLTYRAPFAQTAPVLGAVEYRRGRRFEPLTLALLQGYVPNQGDAWHYTLDALSQFFETVLAKKADDGPPDLTRIHLMDLAEATLPGAAYELIGAYLESARLLGQRTAEMHLALATPTDDESFRPEPFTPHFQRSLYQSLRNLYGRVFEQLRQGLADLPDSARQLADQVLDRSSRITQRFHTLLGHKITAMRTRCHGDYHLGQVLHTGKDFFVVDFEGEPDRSIGERRLKRSPLKDVAGMIRSFHCAAHSGYTERGQLPGVIRPEDVSVLETWATFWYHAVSATFLKAYRLGAAQGGFLPASNDEIQFLLDLFLLEKAVYELGYELNHRPDWVRIPLMGILQLTG